MKDYLDGVVDEKARIVNLLVSMIEEEEIRDFYFGVEADRFFSILGYDLIEIIENG